MERDPGLSQTDRILGLTSAGVGGYATGQSFAGPSAKAPTTPSRSIARRKRIRGGRSFSGARIP